MRRRRHRPKTFASSSDPTSVLLRMGTLLIVLGLIYSWVSKPQSWKWLEIDFGGPPAAAGPDLDGALAQAGPASGSERKPQPKPAADKTHAAAAPAVPTDLDKAEWEKSQPLFEAISDRTVLAPEEMPAYWRLMKWANAQTFADLERRAARDVPRVRLLEQPEKYRGRLLRLRLHIMRILDWDAHENSARVKHVYEAWGWNDQSNALYVCVFSELPPEMKLGEKQHEEGVFVGYFLKDLGYQALNRNQLAPLLVGRMEPVASTGPAPLVGKSDWGWVWWTAGVIVVAIGFAAAALRLRKVRHGSVAPPTPSDEADMEDWFRSEGSQHPADRP
jgi:hypothetical protein